MPNIEELKNSGFLEKKSAISTITELADDLEISQLNDDSDVEDEQLEDFISKRE